MRTLAAIVMLLCASARAELPPQAFADMWASVPAAASGVTPAAQWLVAGFTSSTNVYDATGNTGPATVNAGLSWTPNYMAFDGTGVSTTQYDQASASTETIMGWVWQTSTATRPCYFGGRNGLSIGNVLGRVTVFDGVVAKARSTSTTLLSSTGVWIHVAASRVGNTGNVTNDYAIYINGVQIADLEYAGFAAGGGPPDSTLFGMSPNSTRRLTGRLADVPAYSPAIASNDVFSIYSEGVP